MVFDSAMILKTSFYVFYNQFPDVEPDYQKTEDGQLCSDAGLTQITNQADCESAAAILGIAWARAWNGPGDFPGCLQANDGRGTAYWNRSPNPATCSNPWNCMGTCLEWTW